MTILAVAEHRRGELRDVSLELLSAGASLAADRDEPLHAAVVGGEVETYADALNRPPVDTVHAIAEGEEFNHGVSLQAVEQLATAIEPSAILIPNTVNGLDCAPAVASRLDQSIVTDAIALDGADDLTVTREMYGSKVETTVTVDPPAVVTVRPGEFPAASDTGEATIEPFEVTIDEDAIGAHVQGYQEVGSGDVDITEADVLVSIGRGIGEEENLDIVFDLAEALGGTVSASRPIVDNGWLEKGRQVGQSGKTVAPDVYFAIGISGAVQHVAGIKNADTIVAINTDPNAPIFDIADYGVVGDLFDVVPALIEAMNE